MQVTNFGTDVQTMTSREIAELTGKEHRNVLADIRKMLLELHGEGGMQGFQHTHRNEQNIRIITNQQGEPWFVAKDVAIALGYRDAANMTRNLRVNQKGTLPVSTPSSTQMMTVMTRNLDDDETGTHILRIRSENGICQDRIYPERCAVDRG